MFTPTLRCECAQPASDRLMRKWCITVPWLTQMLIAQSEILVLCIDFACLRWYCTSYPKLACFVLYLKIINTFLTMIHASYSKLYKELKNGIDILGRTPLINRVRHHLASQCFQIGDLAAIPCLSNCQKNVQNGVDALVFMLDVLYC